MSPEPITIQIARPSPAEPTGRVETGYFTVTKEIVRLTDADGHPILRSSRCGSPEPLYWEQKLASHEDARVIAPHLLWSKWRASSRGSDFNRPLPPPKFSIV